MVYTHHECVDGRLLAGFRYWHYQTLPPLTGDDDRHSILSLGVGVLPSVIHLLAFG
jgi:hypothetical protein